MYTGTFQAGFAKEPETILTTTFYTIISEDISPEQAKEEIDQIGLENFEIGKYRDGVSFYCSTEAVCYSFRAIKKKAWFAIVKAKYSPYITKETLIETSYHPSVDK